MNALKQNKHMPLPSSFLLLASSSFLSLAFNASSAFAEMKTIKCLHLFYGSITSEHIGEREKKFLTYYFVKESEAKSKMSENPKYIFHNPYSVYLEYLFRIFEAYFKLISVQKGKWS